MILLLAIIIIAKLLCPTKKVQSSSLGFCGEDGVVIGQKSVEE